MPVHYHPQQGVDGSTFNDRARVSFDNPPRPGRQGTVIRWDDDSSMYLVAEDGASDPVLHVPSKLWSVLCPFYVFANDGGKLNIPFKIMQQDWRRLQDKDDEITREGLMSAYRARHARQGVQPKLSGVFRRLADWTSLPVVSKTGASINMYQRLTVDDQNGNLSKAFRCSGINICHGGLATRASVDAALTLMNSHVTMAPDGAVWRFVNGYGSSADLPQGFLHTTNDVLPIAVTNVVRTVMNGSVYMWASTLHDGELPGTRAERQRLEAAAVHLEAVTASSASGASNITQARAGATAVAEFNTAVARSASSAPMVSSTVTTKRAVPVTPTRSPSDVLRFVSSRTRTCEPVMKLVNSSMYIGHAMSAGAAATEFMALAAELDHHRKRRKQTTFVCAVEVATVRVRAWREAVRRMQGILDAQASIRLLSIDEQEQYLWGDRRGEVINNGDLECLVQQHVTTTRKLFAC
jgi:hypothetical protein